MAGVEEIDRYTYRIRIEKKYPQFVFWLAMNFFALMPWRAELLPAAGVGRKNVNLHWYPTAQALHVDREQSEPADGAGTLIRIFTAKRYPSDGPRPMHAERSAG